MGCAGQMIRLVGISFTVDNAQETKLLLNQSVDLNHYTFYTQSAIVTVCEERDRSRISHLIDVCIMKVALRLRESLNKSHLDLAPA